MDVLGNLTENPELLSYSTSAFAGYAGGVAVGYADKTISEQAKRQYDYEIAGHDLLPVLNRSRVIDAGASASSAVAANYLVGSDFSTTDTIAVSAFYAGVRTSDKLPTLQDIKKYLGPE